MSIAQVGDKESFSYKGSVEEYLIPISGLYLLTCNGAAGGTGAVYDRYGQVDSAMSGGRGGLSKRYVLLEKGTPIFICVGGNGGTSGRNGWTSYSGGYNGGGNGYIGIPNSGSTTYSVGTGGGATHIALMTGTLQTIGKSNLDKVLIVAGGGGGGMYYSNAGTGGAGGGLTGNNGASYNMVEGKGGSQTAAGASGNYRMSNGVGGFGYAAQSMTCSGVCCTGGGGGLYGGGAGSLSGAGGGSGYISESSITVNGTTYTNSTSAGGSTGSSASIKLIEIISSNDKNLFIGNNPYETYIGSTKYNTYLGNFKLN